MSSEKSININTLKSSDIQQINFTNGGSINDNNQTKNVSFEEFTNEPPIDSGSFDENNFKEFADDMEDFGGIIDKEKLKKYENNEKDLNTYIGDLEEKNNENVESLEKFKGNLKDVNINIIKEDGESNIEKMNKNIERLNKNIYNFNEKINNYGVANNEENDTNNELDDEENYTNNKLDDEENDTNDEENTQFGGEVNMRVNEEYHQFQLQKSKEHYKELEKQIEEEIIEEEMEQQEFDMYNDFEDFEIDELSKEDVEIIVKDTENRLEYSDEVLFDNLVDVLRYNPDLMYNSDLPNKEDIKIFDRITISETSGKVELPPYLYKSGMPPYIRTKYGGSGSGPVINNSDCFCEPKPLSSSVKNTFASHRLRFQFARRPYPNGTFKLAGQGSMMENYNQSSYVESKKAKCTDAEDLRYQSTERQTKIQKYARCSIPSVQKLSSNSGPCSS